MADRSGMATQLIFSIALLIHAVPHALCFDCKAIVLRQMIDGDVVSFTSPGYPTNYPPLHQCFTKFSPSSSDLTVRLICNDVNLYQSSGWLAWLTDLVLGRDWVLLATGAILQSFPSGYAAVPLSYSATGGKSITFAFSTNVFNTARGFSCTAIASSGTSASRTCGKKGTGRSLRNALVARRLGHRLMSLLDRANGSRQLFPDDNKIFGGSAAATNEWPWMVFLVIQTSTGDSYCGGTIISPTCILTAAHCFDGRTAGSPITLRYGTSDLAGSNVELMTTTDVTIHPQYSTGSRGELLYDIAILKLNTPLQFSANVQPICLPSFTHRERAYQGSAEITGWGKLGNTAPITSSLQEAKAQMIDMVECRRRTNNAVNHLHVCSDPVTGMSVCPGDSGSPLQISDYDGRYTQIGIVSYGSSSCESDGLYAVYTRVDQYLEWIRDTCSTVTVLP